jgi:t-SNARE complex subunit (syntaxin)
MSLFSKFFGGNKGQGGNGGGAGRAQAFIDKITSDLNLEPEQVSKVEAAIREFFMEKKQMKQSGNKDGMKESKQDFKDDILNALTPAQQQKFMDNIQTYKQLLRN